MNLGRPLTIRLFAGGSFGNGGGKGLKKKELDEFGEDDDNMLNKAEVGLAQCTYLSRRAAPERPSGAAT